MTDQPGTEPDDQTPQSPVTAAERDGEESGHPAVDVAVAAVAAAADLAPAEQVEAYEAAHRTLQETLATIDQS